MRYRRSVKINIAFFVVQGEQLYVKWRWGTKKVDSLVRFDNRVVGTAIEIASLPFLA